MNKVSTICFVSYLLPPSSLRVSRGLVYMVIVTAKFNPAIARKWSKQLLIRTWRCCTDVIEEVIMVLNIRKLPETQSWAD